VFVNASGGYGSPLVTLVGILEAGVDGVSGGEAGAQGGASVMLTRGRALVLSGRHGCDMGEVGTGWCLGNSCRGLHGGWRWTRGVLRDKLGWLGAR